MIEPTEHADREQLCGAEYIDPRNSELRTGPCLKPLGHENGAETDWKRGYHSTGVLKWPVES